MFFLCYEFESVLDLFFLFSLISKWQLDTIYLTQVEISNIFFIDHGFMNSTLIISQCIIVYLVTK